MKTKQKAFFWLLLLITIPVCAAYLLSCLNPWISASNLWLVSMLGLVYPYLLIATLLVFLIWIFYNWKIGVLMLIVLLLGWKCFIVTFSFDINKEDDFSDRNITVLSYNVRNLNTTYDSSVHREFQAIINSAVPQIVCLQEFEESPNKYWPNYLSIQHFSQKLHMPYWYFSDDYSHNSDNYHDGSIIFSQLPLMNIRKIKLSPGSSRQTAISADFVFNNDTVRLITTRLHPFYLGNYEIQRTPGNDNVHLSRRLLYKLKSAYEIRAEQADKLAAYINKSPYPVIVCGDFNTVPVSYSYYRIKGNLRDAFLCDGHIGFGTTYPGLSPNLRIDYMFADKRFHIDEFGIIHHTMSDHYPIYARFSLPQ